MNTHVKPITILFNILILLLSTGLGAETRTYDLEAFLGRVETYSRDLKLAQKDLDLARVRKKEATSTALPTCL